MAMGKRAVDGGGRGPWRYHEMDIGWVCGGVWDWSLVCLFRMRSACERVLWEGMVDFRGAVDGSTIVDELGFQYTSRSKAFLHISKDKVR